MGNITIEFEGSNGEIHDFFEIVDNHHQIVKLFSDHGELSDGGDYWVKRAKYFLNGFAQVLIWRRNNEDFKLTAKSFTEELRLEKIAKTVDRNDIPEDVIFNLRTYIENLPGFDKEVFYNLLEGKVINQKTVFEQHGYVTMQITPLLNGMVGGFKKFYMDECGATYMAALTV